MNTLNAVQKAYRAANKEAKADSGAGCYWNCENWTIRGLSHYEAKNRNDCQFDDLANGCGLPQDEDIEFEMSGYVCVWIEGRTDMWNSRKDFKNGESMEDTWGDVWEVFIKGSEDDI
jgi:hypothetical protein